MSISKCNNDDLNDIAYRLLSGCVACWGYFQCGMIHAYVCDGLEDCIKLVCTEKGKEKLLKRAAHTRNSIRKIEERNNNA